MNISEQRPAFFDDLLSRVSHGAAALMLLTLVTVLIHVWHCFDAVDGWFMRSAVQIVMYRQHDSEASAVKLPERRQLITVIEASTLMRVKELEHDGGSLDQATLDRVGGVRPIDRQRLATLLTALAELIPTLPAGRRPDVVAIDVDVAPLRTGTTEQQAITDALNALRQHVHVIAIVLDRPSPTLRQARNTFMVAAACSRRDAAASAAPPLHDLYFASPRLFQELYGYPLKFPAESLKTAAPGSSPHFPSLGNLIHLLATPQPETKNARATLTYLCEQAANSQGEHLLLDDRVAGADCPASASGSCKLYKVTNDYQLRRINWKLHDAGPVTLQRLESLGQASPKVPETPGARQLPNEIFDVGTIVLGVDGGLRHDRFEGATSTGERVSGPQLHALQAASQLAEYELRENYSVGFFFDLAVGAVFVLLWSAAAAAIRQAQWYRPRIAGELDTFTACVPPALALLLGWAVTVAGVPWLLEHANTWANPAYVLAGLVGHTYLEAWNAHRTAAQHHVQPPDLSYGLASAWRQRAGWVAYLIPLACVALALAGTAALFYKQAEGGLWAGLFAALSILISGVIAWTNKHGRHVQA